MRGRKRVPTAMKRANGNPGKRKLNENEPQPPSTKPYCPEHLSPTAKREWRRIAGTLHEMGVVTSVDRAALAAYCQAYGRWAEAEQKLAEGPTLIKTPSGYVQQSPWLGVANRQMELMVKYMSELGITPASRSRIALPDAVSQPVTVKIVSFSDVKVEPEMKQIDLSPTAISAQH
ncbi:phage terminase small subunit P27 family [Acuticoccus kandeliae]|uniref:phage terminase small subunit P27 family n=1 Tax=Acuticoccus kandeliae TaxID=2073160 RepID=UPI000D3EAEB7|nr:phage terminase small subunit P27 family [Acuticoccus kandeliae]